MEKTPENSTDKNWKTEETFQRFNVLGIGVSELTLTKAVEAIIDRAEKGLNSYVCVTGVHGISEAQENPHIKKCHNNAWMVTPDGMPLVWIGRYRHGLNVTRVYGPDLMLEICQNTAKSELRHFFFGGSPGIAQELAEKLEERFPGLTVCGTYTPPFRALDENEISELKEMVSNARPSIFWVGLSTPKQELFMAEYFNQLNAGVMIGVGAAFDFHTGRVNQAPGWMQKCGLEWFFRLCNEPRRLGKRYLKNNPLFLIRYLLQILGVRKYPLS